MKKQFLKIWIWSSVISSLGMLILWIILEDSANEFIDRLIFSLSSSNSDVINSLVFVFVFFLFFAVLGAFIALLITAIPKIISKVILSVRNHKKQSSWTPRYGFFERTIKYVLDYRLKKVQVVEPRKQKRMEIKATEKSEKRRMKQEKIELRQKEKETKEQGNFSSKIIGLIVFFCLMIVLPCSLLLDSGFILGISAYIIFLLWSIKKLQATKENPVPIALLVLFGRKTRIRFREGLCFVPLFVGSLIEEDGRYITRNIPIKDEDIYTPKDRTVIIFPFVRIVYRISDLYQYEVVANAFEQLLGRITAALKDFITSEADGPQDFDSARGIPLEKYTRTIVAKLMKHIIPMHDVLVDGGSSVPIRKAVAKKQDEMTQEEKDRKEDAKNQTAKLMTASGDLKISDLGIELHEILLGPIDVTDKMKKKLEELAELERDKEKEKIEREKEQYDLDTKLGLAKKLKEDLGINGDESLLRVLQITDIVPGSATNERIYRGNTGNVGVVELLKEEVTGGKK